MKKYMIILLLTISYLPIRAYSQNTQCGIISPYNICLTVYFRGYLAQTKIRINDKELTLKKEGTLPFSDSYMNTDTITIDVYKENKPIYHRTFSLLQKSRQANISCQFSSKVSCKFQE